MKLKLPNAGLEEHDVDFAINELIIKDLEGKKQMKMNVFPIFLLIALIIITGCSSSVKPVKPPENNINNQKDLLQQPVREVSEDIKLIFPVDNDPFKLSQWQRSSCMLGLRAQICLYRRVTDTYPDSISAFIQSGFPLFWPRNMNDGTPVKVIVNRELNIDPSDFGKISWGKTDNYHAQLSSVSLDRMALKKQGVKVWIKEIEEFAFKPPDQYMSLPYEELVEQAKKVKPYDWGGEIDVIGGTTPVNFIPDPATRKLYAMCGQFNDYLTTATSWFYNKNKTMPKNLVEILSVQPSETPFIIKENFYSFARMLKDANAEFIIGYDYSLNSHYSVLKINGEILITYCWRYGEYSREFIDSPGIYHGCHIDEINKSSPMITDKTLENIEIPDQLSISIKDIPFE